MRTVVITGSASGLGAAIRRRLESDGCEVVGVDLERQEIEADLSTPAERAAAMNAVLEYCNGPIDGLVVCAGLGPHVEPVSRLVSVNYFGAVEVLDGLRPALAAGDRPAAVAISSNSIGIVPVDDMTLIDAMLHDGESAALALADGGGFDGSAVYVMTKIALARAVRSRVLDWGRAHIRLNAVAPGPVLTPLLQGSLDDPVLGPLVDALPIPLEVRAQPEDIAGVVSFLLGPDAAFIHGAVLFADGGTDALVRPDVI
jgi:NAD(P)-dependent dehydrogenase (short-subunit alcohol dehydrogenase family)